MIVAKAMGASTSSTEWMCNGEWFVLYLWGDASTSTIALQCAPPNSDTWLNVYADAADGTPTAQSFTVTEVTATTTDYSKVFVASGMKYRLTSNDQGTPSWNAMVSGEQVTKPIQ